MEADIYDYFAVPLGLLILECKLSFGLINMRIVQTHKLESSIVTQPRKSPHVWARNEPFQVANYVVKAGL